MLNVEIRLPGTGQHYDFALDETAPVAAVTRAVAEAICAETHAPAPGDTPLSLYDPARAARLGPCVYGSELASTRRRRTHTILHDLPFTQVHRPFIPVGLHARPACAILGCRKGNHA